MYNPMINPKVLSPNYITVAGRNRWGEIIWTDNAHSQIMQGAYLLDYLRSDDPALNKLLFLTHYGYLPYHILVKFMKNTIHLNPSEYTVNLLNAVLHGNLAQRFAPQDYDITYYRPYAQDFVKEVRRYDEQVKIAIDVLETSDYHQNETVHKAILYTFIIACIIAWMHSCVGLVDGKDCVSGLGNIAIAVGFVTPVALLIRWFERDKL